MQKITPCLFLGSKAEEAMIFYTSVVKNSKVGAVARYGDAGPGAKDSVMTASFEIEGQSRKCWSPIFSQHRRVVPP